MIYQDPKEFARLLEHFKHLTPRSRVLEIGSLFGDTLCEWMRSMDSPGIIVSIDCIVGPLDPRHRQQKDGHQIHWPRLARKFGLEFYCFNDDSTTPLTVANTKLVLPEVDFLMIDGGHDYATVLADWTNYGPLVRPGGMVAFHDLGQQYPGVRPVWEQARKGHVSLEIVESPKLWGIGVLWR
jgi:cephalosporin hydroxylase